MTWTTRHTVTVIALVALGAGVLRFHPCMDEGSCPSACSEHANAASCEGPDDHDGPEPGVRICDCPCHVPAIPGPVAAGPAHDAPTASSRDTRSAPLQAGFLHPPFRPPTA